MGRGLLDEEKPADGREPGNGKRGHQRETSRQVEPRSGRATSGPPGIAGPVGPCRRHPRPRPDGSERPTATSPLHRLSHAEVEGSGVLRAPAGMRQVSCPGKTPVDRAGGRQILAPVGRNRLRPDWKERADLSSRTDNLTCDEMPRAATKIVTSGDAPSGPRAPGSRGGIRTAGAVQGSRAGPSPQPARAQTAAIARPQTTAFSTNVTTAKANTSRGERRRWRTLRASGPSSTHAVHPVEGADPERWSPRELPRQCWITKPIGERHCRRHEHSSGEN